MKLKGRLFSVFVAFALTLQMIPINILGVSANENLINETEIKEEITAFIIGEEITQQQMDVGSETAIVLPESIAVKVKPEVEGDELLDREVSVIWQEVHDKTFTSSSVQTFLYEAQLQDETYVLSEGVTLPTISVDVLALQNTQKPAVLNDPLGGAGSDPEGIADPTPAIGESANGNLRIMLSTLPYATAENPDFKWDYPEGLTEPDIEDDTMRAYNYEIQVVHDDSLPAGSIRTITVNLDPFSNGVSSPLKFGTVPNTATFIQSTLVSSDKLTVTYEILNDVLKNTAGTITFTLQPSGYFGHRNPGYETTYYKKISKTEGTLASNIGVMLLLNPNGKLGIELREEGVEESTVLLEHPLLRDNQSDAPLFSDMGTLVNELQEAIADKNISSFYLGSDGYLYLKDDATGKMIVENSEYNDGLSLVEAPVYGNAYDLITGNHTPIGDFYFKSPYPDGFQAKRTLFNSNTVQFVKAADWYIDTRQSLSEQSLLSDKKVGGVYNTSSNTSNLSDAALILSTIQQNDSNGPFYSQMLTGVRTIQEDNLVVVFGGNHENAIAAYNPLFRYDQPSYQGDPIIAQYNQVITNPDTTSSDKYITKAQEQELGQITVNIPEYTYQDLITMEASVPEKVNTDDPVDMEYNFSIFNLVDSYIGADGNRRYTNEYIENNIAHYFHNDGTMTMNFADENFNPTTLTLPNEYTEFISYQITYTNGEKSDVISTPGEIYIEFTPHADSSEVASVTFNISSNGLVETGKASGYSTGGHFTGIFKEPTDGTNSIKVDVTFESTGNAKTKADPASTDVVVSKAITWEYAPGVDYLHTYQDITGNSTLTLNNDKFSSYNTNSRAKLNFGFAIPMEMVQSSVVYSDVEINLFDTTQLEGTPEEILLETTEINAVLAQLGETFTFLGEDNKNVIFSTNSEHKIWIEYTTNLNTTTKKFYIEPGINATYTIPKQENEYYTSFVFRADYLRLLGADVEYLSTGMDVIPLFENFDFEWTRYDDVPKVEPGKRIAINAYAEAVNLTPSWTPTAGEPSEYNLNKNYSSNLGSNSTNISDAALQYGKTVTVEGYATNFDSITLPFDGTMGSHLSGSTTIDSPVKPNTSASTYYWNGLVYPPNTNVYLQLNTSQFRYVGDNERITKVEKDGKTWLIYDLEGFNMSVYHQGKEFSLSGDDFIVTNDITPNTNYQLFLDGYADAASLFQVDGDFNPYFTFIPNTTFETNGLTNADLPEIAALNNDSYAGKRYIQLNVNETMPLNVATNHDILLYPGIDGVGEKLTVAEYVAHQNDDLNLQFDLGSNTRVYENYNIIITLPRAVDTEIPEEEEATTTKLSLYLDSLSEESVILSDSLKENGYNIAFASSASFNEGDATDVTFVEATSIEDAQYVVITVNKIPQHSFGEVELKLHANDEEMYIIDDNINSFAFVNTKYQYQEGDIIGSTLYNVDASKNVAPAQYVFRWYEVSGLAYEELSEYIPDGINESSTDDSIPTNPTNILYFKNLRNILPEGTPEIISANYVVHDETYSMRIQPRESVDGQPAYELVLDLESIGKQDTHVMSLNTSGISLSNNNNAPRDQSVGITLYADTTGLNSVRDGDGLTKFVEQSEVDNGNIDFAIYANPVLSLDPTITELEKGTTKKIEAILSGQGYIKENSEYIPVDGTTYGTVTSVLADDKRSATIDLTGVEITFDDTTNKYVYKDAITTLVNYFGDEIDVTSQYLVYVPPKVTFHTYTRETPAVLGKWDDGTALTTKDVQLNAAELEFESGSLLESQVPVLNAPSGYVFVGWELADGTDISFSLIPTLLNANENLYPRFSPDVLIDEDRDLDPTTPGDGIPDIYQTTVNHVVVNGTWEGETETTVSEVVTFVDDENQPSQTGTATYDVEIPNPNTGYANGKWTDDLVPSGTLAYTPDEVTFTHTYTPSTYNVIFDANTGTGTMPNQEMEYDSPEDLSINIFEKPNHIFMGWSTTSTGEVEYTDEQNVVNLTTEDGGTVTLYAVWEEDVLVDEDRDLDPTTPGDGIPDKYQTTVNHVVVNGTWEGETETTVSEVVTFVDEENQPSQTGTATYDVEIPNPNTGYANGKWTDDLVPSGTLAYTPDEVTFTHTYTPNFYDVVFEENGGSTVPDQTVEVGQLVTEPTPPVKDNHTFIGWYLDKELTVKYDFNTLMPENNIVLYAKYEKNTVAPPTGDTTNSMAWIGLMFTAIAIAIASKRKIKR